MAKLTKKDVEKKVKKLAKTLKEKLGGKWQTRVWENFGWCYSVHLGSIEVMETISFDKTIYTAYISSCKGHTGGAMTEWFDSDDSDVCPHRAVQKAMARSQVYVNKLQAVLDDNMTKMNDL